MAKLMEAKLRFSLRPETCDAASGWLRGMRFSDRSPDLPEPKP